MEYPRELKLDPEREAALISYLNTELMTHQSERATWVRDLQSWQDDYWASPSTSVATYPYKGAANVIVPLTAIAVESIHAREMTSLFALPDQIAATTILDPTQQDLNHDLQRAVNYTLLKNGANLRHFADEALLESTKLGTCVGKSGYQKVVKTAVKVDPGGVETEFEVVTKQGSTATAVPLANFLMPFTAIDPQTAPWCGEEHLENLSLVKSYCDSGFFRPEAYEKLTDSVVGYGQNLSSTPYTQEVRKFQDQTPIQWPKEIGWQEIWLSFDVDGSGKEKEIVVHYHRMYQFFFSIRYNWHDDLHRPYRIARYFPLEHRWAGIGVGKQNEQFQSEVTTQHRQRIDNATLANMRMFKVKQGIGISPDEPLFPGKIWFVDEMDDVQDIQLGEIYPSSFNDEQMLVTYSQQRLGVNELNLGMPQSGTPGTATSDMQRMAEYNRRFDYSHDNHKIFMREIAIDVLCNESQFGFRDPRFFTVLGPNGSAIEQILKAPCDVIRSGFLFDVNIVSQSQNDLVDRNNYTQYAGMLTQYYTQMIQLAQMALPQLLPVLVVQAIKAGTEAMQQISDSFNIRGADRFLIPQQLIAMLMSPNGPKTIGPGGGPNQGTPGNQPNTGIPSSNSSGGGIPEAGTTSTGA